MITAPLVVAAVLVLRALPVRRFVFWSSWSWWAAAAGVVATFLVLAFVSFAGVYAADAAGWADGPTPLQAAAASLAAHAAVRRPARNDPTGASLALGVLPDAHAWVTGLLVERRVERWAIGLDDPALVAAAQRVERSGRTTSAGDAGRAALRKRRVASLCKAGPEGDDAREHLVDHVISGHIRYELRRPQ